ncbi:hypothetical protein AGMMS50268_22900 [Spirochaetia bacterium]|nr:hypothetical protein AGMMS50268_22900 [Spirochaetia bacterium]
MKSPIVLLAVFSVVALAFMGCATTGVIADSEGFDIRNSSGDKHVRPKWLKNSGDRDGKNKRVFTVKGVDSEYTKQDVAIAELNKLAQRRISEYIDKTIKVKSTDYFWGTTENDNISGREEVTSFAEAYTEVKLQGISQEKYYWELTKGKGKEPYYTVWGEYSIPNDAIEEARKFIKEKETAENYMARKTAEDNKRFAALRDDFSREIEPFFINARKKELFFADQQKYQTRYSHLVEIKAHLESLGSLKEQTVYQNFAFEIKEMVEDYEPTEMMVLSNREQFEQLKLEYESKYAQYETRIARLDERNNILKDEKDEVFALFNKLSEELQQRPADTVLNNSLEQQKTIAQLEERIKVLKDEKDEVFALFNKLSEELQQRPTDTVLNNSLEQQKTIAQLEERNNTLKDEYETRIARLDERNNALKDEKDEVFALFNTLSEELQQRPADTVLNNSLDQQNNAQGVEQYQDEYIRRAVEFIFSWQVPSIEELAKAEKYQVKEGDTLAIIARRRYGSAFYFPWVYRCNQNVISNWDLIRSGEILRLPDAPGSIDSIFTEH